VPILSGKQYKKNESYLLAYLQPTSFLKQGAYEIFRCAKHCYLEYEFVREVLETMQRY
jgi:hypothetical protein